MKGNPLVSIITPCYNGEKFVARYFESILAQTYTNMELIFINDGSEDKTEEIALSYKEKLERRGIRFIYEYQKNAGQAAALNRGLKHFTGEYLTWPDSDDVMKKECIEKKVDFLEKNPQYGLCVCKTEIVNENAPNIVAGIYERVIPTGTDNFFEDIIFLNNVYLVPGGYMLRANTVLSTIPEREIYTGRGGQNVQMLLPVLYQYKCGYIQEVLNTYFVRKESHSHNVINSKEIIEQIKLYETILFETLKRVDINVVKKYEMPIKRYYAAYRFGNAIDSKEKRYIKEEFANLRKCKCVSFKNLILFIVKMIH